MRKYKEAKLKVLFFTVPPEEEENFGKKAGSLYRKRRKFLYIYWCATSGTTRVLFGSNTKD